MRTKTVLHKMMYQGFYGQLIRQDSNHLHTSFLSVLHYSDCILFVSFHVLPDLFTQLNIFIPSFP